MDARGGSRASHARRIWLASLAAAALAGCFADPTEVVVVVDTDAQPGTDFSEIQLILSGEQTRSSQVAFSNTAPVTVGVTPYGGSPSFEVVVTLTGGALGSAVPFATRKVSGVSFVTNQMRMLFIPMFKTCACVDATGAPSTSCPHALWPECRDLANPTLPAFDEDNIPRVPRLPASTSP